MKGNQRVIAHLQRLLASTLACQDQFLLHARMYEDWGYHRLTASADAAVAEQREQVSRLMRRMLFLGTTPDLTQREGVKVGTTVRDMLRHDLDTQMQVMDALRTAISCCTEERDFQSRRLFADLLEVTEEHHAFWLEQQIGLLETLGDAAYLAAQL